MSYYHEHRKDDFIYYHAQLSHLFHWYTLTQSNSVS